VKTLFDTSTLVQALGRSLDWHSRAAPWLQRAIQGEFEWVVAAHTLAELYGVLTTLPISPRPSPAQVRRLIRENVEKHATIVALTPRDYRDLIRELAEAGMIGGVVYDALICRVAQKASVQRLLTFNVAHFQRVWPEGADIIMAP